MRPLVGLLIEFGVCQPLPGEHHRRRLRMTLDLSLDQLMNALVDRMHHRARVPVREQLLLLRVIEHRQLGNALGRVLNDRPQQVAPVLRQAFDGRSFEQVGGVFEHRFNAMGLFGGVQHQVELRGCALPFQRLDAQAVQAGLDADAAFGLVVEHHLEQRAVTQAASRLQCFHQLFERQVLMRLGFLGGLPNLT
jgi:hypothetical protein